MNSSKQTNQPVSILLASLALHVTSTDIQFIRVHIMPTTLCTLFLEFKLMNLIIIDQAIPPIVTKSHNNYNIMHNNNNVT